MKTWKPFKRDDVAINQLLDMVYGYQKSRTLFTASELDIFSIIGTDSKTASELAVMLNTEKRATTRLLDALCGMELLEKHNDKYQNSKISLRFLVKSKPDYISIMKYSSIAWDAWSHLTETIRSGKPKTVKGIEDLTKEETESFIDAVHWRSALLARDIVKMIDLTHVNKAMDFGGGVGDYAIEFVNQKPEIESVVYTYENCAPFAEEYLNYIKNRDALKTVKIEVGDLLEGDIGSGYDLIFLSFVIQNFSIWDNIKLVKKLYEALNYGGRVVIQDLLINDGRTTPEFNALYSLELLATTGEGDTYTMSDIWLMLKEAWFTKIESVNTDFGTSLVFGTKG